MIYNKVTALWWAAAIYVTLMFKLTANIPYDAAL